MAAIKDQAIALRRLDYSESSQVLVFLTRGHGIQRLIGKGLKRGTKHRFAVGIDLLERGQVVFLPVRRPEGGLGTLTEWRQLDAYLGLRDRLRSWYASQYAAEITAAMSAEADPHPERFDALAELLASLAQGGEATETLVSYQCVLLRSAGLWPDLFRCVVCNRPAPPGRAGYYSAIQGGLVCRQCQPSQPETRQVKAATLTALRERACRGDVARDALALLDYTLCHAIGRATFLRNGLLPE